MRQLVYQVCYTRCQVSFYLWWIRSVLKYWKVPKYYGQDCRCIFKAVKKQKHFPEPFAKSLEPDLRSRITARFKMWFLCDNSFGILILNYYYKEPHLRCCDGLNYWLNIFCWEYSVLINNHNQNLIGVMKNQKKLMVVIYESIFYLKESMSASMVFLAIIVHNNYCFPQC